VVTSASYAAREYGVRSAMPTGKALRLCPDATVVPVPGVACRSKSRAILDVLRTLAPVVEPASIDEFYLDLGGTERMLGGEPLSTTAERIRDRVLEATDISVSIGAGSNRMVAKLATRRAKPAGVHVVPPGAEADFLREHELRDLPGVGPKLADSLAERGLVRVEDALGVRPEWWVRWYGERRGMWLHDRIRGVASDEVHEGERRKSISSERTFSGDIDDDAELERRLLSLVGGVGHALREKGFVARTVTVKLRDHDFTTRQASRTLPEPVESDAALWSTARELLAELRSRRRRPARLLGVGVGQLEPADAPRQMPLFEEAGRVETERDRRISRLMDGLRDRYGPDAVRPGRTLEEP
jgi:DNA polymerase-4